MSDDQQHNHRNDHNIHRTAFCHPVKQVLPVATIFQDAKSQIWESLIDRLCVQIKATVLEEYNKLEIQRQKDDIAAYMEECYLTPAVDYDSDFEIWANTSEFD